jgi:hypothetical protein
MTGDGNSGPPKLNVHARMESTRTQPPIRIKRKRYFIKVSDY